MTLGIVACSSKKMPTPCPAWLLYSASPSFSQCFLAARQDCGLVRILSGRHGLIDPKKIIAPYDQRVSPDRPGLAEELLLAVQKTGETDIVSYCPSEYNRALRLVAFRPAATGGIYEKAAAIGRRGSVKGNVFPLRQSLLWLYANSGSSTREFQLFCQRTWKNQATAKSQFNRLLKSPFAVVRNGLVFYAFEQGL
jgi:hypothetical protein